MAFLFQDQNQGIRNDAPRGMRLSRPFSFIRTLTDGFGSAPKLLTLPQRLRKALAGLGLSTLTAGGDFHPALRTSAARYERPFGIMASGGHGSKALTMGNPHVPMPPEPDCKRQNEQSRRPNRTRAPRIRRARTRTPR